jgi:hypothetical protein
MGLDRELRGMGQIIGMYEKSRGQSIEPGGTSFLIILQFVCRDLNMVISFMLFVLCHEGMT